MIDDDDALAKFLDISHVVAGEHGDDGMFAMVSAEEVAHALLRGDVEADGGFVEEKDFWAMEQGGDELHFHAFSEGEFADHDVHFVGNFEEFREGGDGGLKVVAGDLVDDAVEFEGFASGEIPPEGIFLAHEERELAFERVLSVPWGEAQYGGRP